MRFGFVLFATLGVCSCLNQAEDPPPPKEDELGLDAALVQGTGGVSFISISHGAAYPNPVLLAVSAPAGVTEVQYEADGWQIGSSTTAFGDWALEYRFNDIGNRVVRAKAFNSARQLVGEVAALVRVTQSLVPAIAFLSPALEEGAYLNGVWFKVSGADARVTAVRYMVGTWEIGRSTDLSANYAVLYTFSELGRRTVRAEALGADGAVIATASRTLIVSGPPGTGNCAMRDVNLEMSWSSCAVADCFNGNGGPALRTPTTGPVAKEAHLVTTQDGFGSSWPYSFTDGLNDHYQRSQTASGYSMARQEPWAPSGEGGSEYGQGSTGSKIPVVDEAWYITMYWYDLPAGGTRMIVRNPATGKAVVASAGWETGPGDNETIAGVTEEIHNALGTGHLDDLEIGFAADNTLPLGPIRCN